MSLGYRIGDGSREGGMWTDSLPVFGSTGYHHAMLGNFSCPVDDRHQLARPGMPQRYESEEEEVSEVDTPNWEDRSFSATDIESLAGGFESDTTNDSCVELPCTPDDDTFTLRMPSGLSADGYSRPTSVYTIKPANNCGVLSPMPLLSSSDHQDSSASAESDTAQSSNIASPGQMAFTPSTSYESDPNPNFHSFYSDTLSSDEDFSFDIPFLTATPITYYMPSSRPNLVSVSQHSLDSGLAKVSKKPKRLRPASVVRQASTSSNRSTATINNNSSGIRARLQRNRTAKQEERRWSTVLSTEVSLLPCNSPPPSTASQSSSDEVTFFRARDSRTSSTYSMSDDNGSKPNAVVQEKPLWPLPPAAPLDRRMSEQKPQSSPQSSRVSPRGHRPADSDTFVSRPPRVSSYRTYADETVSVPHPSTIGLASSSPKPFIRHAAPEAQPAPRRGSYNFYRAPPAPPVLESPQYAAQNPRPPPFPAPWGDPFPSPPYSDLDDGRPSSVRGRTSRERARSISSIASSSSKFSLPSFDAGSVKSMMHRSRRQNHNDSTSSAGSSVGIPPQPLERGRRLMMNSEGCKSTSNLSFFFSSTDERQGSVSSSSSQSPTKMYRRSTASPSQQLLRLKNTKWFNETSETVGQVGSRALSGIGSILRKKSGSPMI